MAPRMVFEKARGNIEMEFKKRVTKETHITSREKQLIEMIANGYSDMETSERLGIALQTIRGKVNTILKKTETNNRPQLVFWAIQNGVI